MKISDLQHYDVAPLRLEDELASFQKAIQEVRRRPHFAAIEQLCLRSRALLYAVTETGWWLGWFEPSFQKGLEQAFAAFEEVACLREKALGRVVASRRAKAATYFTNIAARKWRIETLLSKAKGTERSWEAVPA